MKTKFKLLIFAFLSGICISSCSQEEMIYSCDESINSWVEENISEIKKMDRAHWLELDSAVRKAAYRAFTPEQKFQFWMDKFNETLTLSWNQEEKTHILKSMDFFQTHRDIFEPSISDNDKMDLDLFTYTWVNDAQEKLGWDKKVCFAIIASGDIIEDCEGNLKPLKKSRGYGDLSGDEIKKENCNCSTESDWCGVPITNYEDICKETPCKVINGCGTFFVYDCDGRCES